MGKSKEMSETVHTSITLAMVSGVIMAFVGVLFARGALELMGTPDDVVDQSTLYMRIYFMGMPFLCSITTGRRSFERSEIRSGRFFSDHLRTDQRSIEYAARYLLSYGSGRRGDRYGDLTADLMHPGIMVPV